MCLAIPARIVEMTGDAATVDMEGVRRSVSTMLLPDAKVGEYVIVHAGFAIGRLDEKEAEETLRMIRSVLGSDTSSEVREGSDDTERGRPSAGGQGPHSG